MLWPTILVLASTIAGAPESPRESPVRLRWSAPGGCPSAQYLRARTEALLGRGLDDSRHPQVEASVTVRAQAGRWSASLVLATREGRRARPLRAASCEALADAAALLLAITVDPTAQLTAVPVPANISPGDRYPVGIPESVSVDEPGTSSEAQPVAKPVAPRAVQTRPPRPRGFLGAAFTLQGGGAPGLALGMLGSGGLDWPRARLLLTATYAAAARPLVLVPGARLDTRQGSAAIAGCGRITRRRLELPLCGGWFVGAIRGAVRGLERGRALRLPWTGLLLAVGLRYAIHRRVALAIDAMALVPVVRPSFLVDGLGVVHTAPSVAGSGQVGLELRLP